MTFTRIAFVKEAKFVLYANRKVSDRFILDRTLPENIDIKIFKVPTIESTKIGINSTWKDVPAKWKRVQFGVCSFEGTTKEKNPVLS